MHFQDEVQKKEAMTETKIMFVCVFLFALSISLSWECRIKILALPIQTLPSSSKQKSIQAQLC